MTDRRRGSKASATREKILEAAHDLLRSEGYGAITTRRIGERAGINFQLVHYYFTSLDALFAELFRQGAEQNLARLDELVSGDVSLRTVWQVNSDASGGRLMTEFAAMANHNPNLRHEIGVYARRFRQRQLELTEQAFARDQIPTDVVPPGVVTLLTLGLGQLIALDRAVGITDGHNETREWIEEWLEANISD